MRVWLAHYWNTNRTMTTLTKVEGPIPDGVWPTMITPFLDDNHKSIDWEELDGKCCIITSMLYSLFTSYHIYICNMIICIYLSPLYNVFRSNRMVYPVWCGWDFLSLPLKWNVSSTNINKIMDGCCIYIFHAV